MLRLRTTITSRSPACAGKLDPSPGGIPRSDMIGPGERHGLTAARASSGPCPRLCLRAAPTPLDPPSASRFLSHRLRYPRFTPNPALMSDEARIFRPGEPVEATRVPLQIGQGGDVFGLAGPVPYDVWVVLDHAVEIIHRIMPWTNVYAVPVVVFEAPPEEYPRREIIRRRGSGKYYVKVGGLSFDKEGLIALSLSSSSVFLVSTAYHEAWHQVEAILDNKILDEIDACLIPVAWGSAYLDSKCERRARAFETWCMRFEEGMPGIRLSSRVDEIFDAVATGEVAREWTKEQQKVAARAARYQSR